MKLGSLADWWRKFEAKVIPPEAGPQQRQSMRDAFYSGASSMMQINIDIGEPSVSEDEALATLNRVRDEILDYALDRKADADRRDLDRLRRGHRR